MRGSIFLKIKNAKNNIRNIILSLTSLLLMCFFNINMVEAVTVGTDGNNQTTYTFSFTGSEEQWNVPNAGTYRLEVWGAQGIYNGGYGGYAKGEIAFSSGQAIKVYVGGSNGFNGGGSSGLGRYGGGATDIRTGSYSLNDRVIVAGGGGSGGRATYGGAGGGLTGGAGTACYGGAGTGASQSAGGSGGNWASNGGFGYGGNGHTYGGGAGGGWYGGGGGGDDDPSYNDDDDSGGGGGSSYYGSLTNPATSTGIQSGNGYARITRLNSPPVIVSQSYPVNSATYQRQDALPIQGTVSDDKAGSVQIWYRLKNNSGTVMISDRNAGNVSVAANTNTSFSYSVNISSITSSGNYTLDVWAIDSEGAASAISSKTFWINVNRPPTLTLNLPASNITVSDVAGSNVINMTGKITDPDGNAVTMSATISGVTKSTTVTAPTSTPASDNWTLSWNVNTDNIAEGMYSNIVVTANDGNGGTDSKTNANLIIVDRTAPSVTSIVPTSGAIDVSRSTSIVVTFSEAISQGSAFNSVTLTSDTGTVVTTTKSISGSTMTVVPSTQLDSGTTYTLRIPASGVLDGVGHGNGLYTSNFTTIGPRVVSASPYDGQQNVDMGDLKINVYFNLNIKVGTTFSAIQLKNGSGNTIAYTWGIVGKTLTITPNPSSVAQNTTYILTLPVSSIMDTDNNPLSQQTTITFKTATDTEKPQILNESVAAGSSISKATTVTFNVTDNTQIAKVEYAWTNGLEETYVDATKISGTTTSATYKTTTPKPGYDKLIIRAYDAVGNIGTKTLQYNYTLTSIAISPTFTTILYTQAPGGPVKVTATYADGTTADITSYSTIGKLTYTSTDATRAYISSNVLYSGAQVGSATITATHLGKTATCIVNVTGTAKTDVNKPVISGITPASGSSISKTTTVQFNVTDDTQIAIVQYMWTNGIGGSYQNATLVSGNGTSAVYKTGIPSPGYTQLWLKASDSSGNLETVQVKYNYPVQSISIDPTSKTIAGLQVSGGALSVIATYTDGTTSDVTDYISIDSSLPLTYTSSNAAVSYVQNGVVYSGNTAGTATITASYGGKSGTCVVTVTDRDNVPPKVLSSKPSNGQTNVSYDTNGIFNVYVYYNEAVTWDSNATRITMSSADKTYAVNVICTGTTLKISTAEILTGNTVYTVSIPAAAIKDIAGNAMSTKYEIRFTTAATSTDADMPTLVSSNPLKDQKLLVSGSTVNLVFVFSENIKIGPNFSRIALTNVTDNTNVSITNKAINGQQLIITAVLQANKRYKLFIPGPGHYTLGVPPIATETDPAITDMAGNPYAGL